MRCRIDRSVEPAPQIRSIQARIRAAAGFASNAEIARRTGFHTETVRRYLSASTPALPFVLRVCEVWHLNANWLLFGLEPQHRVGLRREFGAAGEHEESPHIPPDQGSRPAAQLVGARTARSCAESAPLSDSRALAGTLCSPPAPREATSTPEANPEAPPHPPTAPPPTVHRHAQSRWQSAR